MVSDVRAKRFAHLTRVHPCYGEQAHFTYARLHLPIAPRCNIQCNYCVRSINKCEYRPGVTSGILSVELAVKRVEQAMGTLRNLKVIGIAGPGEPLANESTFKFLKIARDKFPRPIKCISTNGLLLPEKAKLLADLGVKAVTVTINAIDERIGSMIYEWVFYKGAFLKGVEGTRVLIKNQLKGVEEASRVGLVTRINFVLIPGINDKEVVKVAMEAANRGAVMMNIIPLIPLYKFKDLRPPTCEELRKARDEAEKYIPQFRLCKQCRADSCGVPGLEKMEVCTLRSNEHFHG
ncbi:MAG: nitrogenase molybdenum-iron cofactor biosynthesis protein [Candidatus Methanomethylicota archaeon]|uniref:FeMo cofactor biosynthesis protein NifB n=1 Tax=Thermoproteota archaeon TaxID=2056631 RepID=A0A497EMP0_9CREN|nr:MAG: nitrogenase molybdenum-iron cofactor biosynthesis protein [Candidatus Verstraetearchaeota archaeon]